MSKTLSHSQINTFSSCGKKYQYHYIERLREPVTSGALVFGSALDATNNEMLLDLQKSSLKTLSYYQTQLRKNWLHQRINNNVVELPESLEVVYADSDHDYDLLTEQDIAALHDRALKLIPQELTSMNKREALETAYGKLAAIKKAVGIENVHENTARYLNLENWHVLLRKGELMTATIYNHVLPQIAKVVAVQKKIEITNEDGDTVIGYIDAILQFQGEDFPRIVDLKTSTIKYDADAADVSPQLAVYGFETNINKTAFIVLSKAIKKNKSKICAVCRHDGSGSRARTCDAEVKGKRCAGAWIETCQPEATFDLIKGEISQAFSDNVLDNFEEVLKSIRAGNFYRNFNACWDFGRRCPYYSLCHKGKEEGLVKV